MYEENDDTMNQDIHEIDARLYKLYLRARIYKQAGRVADGGEFYEKNGWPTMLEVFVIALGVEGGCLLSLEEVIARARVLVVRDP